MEQINNQSSKTENAIDQTDAALRSEMNIFKSPVGEPYLIKMEEPGRLNTLIRQKFRVPVSRQLTRDHGLEFCEAHWQFFCDRIIMAFIQDTYPEYVNKQTMLSPDQIGKLKEQFPEQFKVLQRVDQAMRKREPIGRLEEIMNANYDLLDAI